MKVGRQSYLGRLALLIAFSIALNILGLLVSEVLGGSLLFFDMCGTALAAFRGGLFAGFVVAALSQLVGSELVGVPDYLAFLPVNLAGAWLWMVLPRIGYKSLGAKVFEPAQASGYKKLFWPCLTLGVVVGGVCGALAGAIQLSLYFQQLDLIGAVTGNFPDATRSGQLNIATTKVLLQSVSDLYDGPALILIANSLIWSVLDKIVATSVTIILILSLFSLPNDDAHVQKIKSDPLILNKHFFCQPLPAIVVFLAVGAYYLNYIDSRFSTLVYVPFTLVWTVFLLSPIVEKRYCYRIDRSFVQIGEPGADHLFFDVAHPRNLKYPREVFEDILKLIVGLIGVVSLPIIYDRILSDTASYQLIFEKTTLEFTASQLISIAVLTAAQLTAFRYLGVVLLRLNTSE